MARLSNGIELRSYERYKVKSLVDIEVPRGGKRKPIIVRKGDRVEVGCWIPWQFRLLKPGTGNINYNEVLSEAIEGVHFELYEGSDYAFKRNN